MIDRMRSATFLIALLLLSCSTPPPPTPPPSPPLDPALREKVDNGARKQVKVPKNAGLAVGLLLDGHPYVLGYGTPAPDGDTVFEIGSVTKTFTAALLWKAVQKGEVALDDPIDGCLPKEARHGTGITLAQLATHTSGLARLPDNLSPKDATNPYADYTPADLYDSLESVEIQHKPGARYDYSNYGAGLLGQILADRAGKSYEELVKERICAPLGLHDTTIKLSGDQRRRLALGRTGDGKATPNWDLPGLAGAGALRSTARDMLRYLEAQFGDDYAPLQQPRVSVDSTMGVGLGWHLLSMTPKAPRIVWHNGGTGGYRSFVGFVRETRTAVVVLCNAAVDVDLLGITLLKLLQDVK